MKEFKKLKAERWEKIRSHPFFDWVHSGAAPLQDKLLIAPIMAVFVSGLLTNLDDSAIRRQSMSAGGQVDLRFSVLSALDMTFSAGAAVRVADGVPPAGEFMVSLRVLR